LWCSLSKFTHTDAYTCTTFVVHSIGKADSAVDSYVLCSVFMCCDVLMCSCRLADHFGGKLHMGYVTIRDRIKLLEVSITRGTNLLHVWLININQ